MSRQCCVKITGARLAYSRGDIFSIRSSPSLDLSLVENIRSCGSGIGLPKKRTHRGRKEQFRIPILSHHTADSIAVLFPDFELCVTDRCSGPDFNSLMSIPLPTPPKPTADTLRPALFNTRCVNDLPQRAEISTFIIDN